MVLRRVLPLVLVLLVLVPPAVQAQRDPAAIIEELKKLAWQGGPGEGAIGAQATIRIPIGFSFLDDGNTRRFLELMGNPPRDQHYLIAPANLDWFAVFSFDPAGYVRDDEKIDAQALLESLRKGDGPGNEERKRLGMGPIYTDGWHVPPRYDPGARRLEWGMRLRDDRGALHVNYTNRLLGRGGVMSAVLVASPQTMNDDMKAFNRILAGYKFVAGEQYAEFRQDDRIAGYGLAALVLGGAAAAKTGMFEPLLLWTIVAGALVAGGLLLKKFFGRKKTVRARP